MSGLSTPHRRRSSLSGSSCSGTGGYTHYALLSGAHPTLPLAEARAVVEAWGGEPGPYLEMLLLYNPPPGPRLLVEQTGMTREAGEALLVCEAAGIDYRLAAETIASRLPPGAQVRIEFTRLRGYARGVVDAASVVEGLAGELRRLGATPTPRARYTARVIVVEGVALIGILGYRRPRGFFEERRPHRKPFYKPGPLDPRLARVFVNLSRPVPGMLYYDPFCGTAGFAVEAGLIGLRVACSDLDPEMAEGAPVNLDAYGVDYIAVVEADARSQPVRGGAVDCIGTDPPYGRSIKVRGGATAEQLLSGFLREAARVLKPCRHVAFAAPHWVDVDSLVAGAGLELREKHYMRVHGGLTRILVVARKRCG